MEKMQELLAVAARLTTYPSDQFHEELEEIKEFAGEQPGAMPFKQDLQQIIEGLQSLSLREAREKYVAAFDLQEKTALYLTAHELGDSRKRGMALIELNHLIRSMGFEPAGGELPDYLPMLYELAATGPEDEDILKLMDRLAYATHRIRIHFPEQNPYKQIFDVLMENVFTAPTEEKMRELESRREKPDLDPMPYPLMYK